VTTSRVVTWNNRSGRRPHAKSLERVVKEFFGPRGPKVETDPDRLYIMVSRDHWIEVVLDSGTVDVVTRNVGSVVDILADRLAVTISTRFNGDLEKPIPRRRVVEDPNALPDYDDEDFV